MISCVAFQQDNVIGGSWDQTVKKWEVVDGKEVGRVIKLASTVRSVAVSKDGHWIVCGGDGGLATVCDGSTHEKVIEVKGHAFGVIAVDVSPSSTRFATGSYDQTAVLWDIPTGKKVAGPLKHEGQVSGIKFSPDGHRLATASWDDSSIRIFDSQSGRLLIRISEAVHSVHSTPIAWSNDGQHIFAVYRGKIKELDVSTGSLRSMWTVHGEHNFASVTLARDGKFIAYSTAKPGLVSLWDTAAHSRLGPVVEFSGEVRSIALKSDGHWLAAGQYDNRITLQNLTDILPHTFVDVPTSSPQMSSHEVMGPSDPVEEPRPPRDLIPHSSVGLLIMCHH